VSRDSTVLERTLRMLSRIARSLAALRRLERFVRPLHPDEIKRGALPRYPGERIDGASSASPGRTSFGTAKPLSRSTSSS
jgi:hypothetical protein